MTKHTILQKDYTLNQRYNQLKLPFDLEVIIPGNDSVRLLSQFVEELDLSDLYSTYERIPENPSPRCLLKIVLYSYMNKGFSSRSMEENLPFKYRKVVADAGYESEENYGYLEKNGQEAFLKTANYEISKTRKYKADAGRAENMEYDEGEDAYTCKNGKRLTVSGIRRQKTRSGYERETTVYSCADCSGCAYKKECIKGNNSKKPLEERNKNLQVSKQFDAYRKADLERITSEEGRELRMNRSIQAEGFFGDLKQDTGFRRFLCRGNENVRAEITLLAMAHNMKKLHRKIQRNRTGTHLFPIKKSA